MLIMRCFLGESKVYFPLSLEKITVSWNKFLCHQFSVLVKCDNKTGI